jgi:alpha-L-fucosidase
MIQEALEFGQRLRSYTVSAMVGGQLVQVAEGNSVGNKRIDHFKAPVLASALVLTVRANQAAPLHIKHFAAITGAGC